MSATTVPVFDLQIYEESTLNHLFAFKLADENGNPTGPYDLTGLELEVTLRDVLATDKVWLSSEAPDEDGSYISITDAPAGLARLMITSQTFESLRNLSGDWALRRVYTAENKELMLRGSVVVNTLVAGGTP